MLRIILGIIAGFIVWSIIWVGSDFVLAALSPDWWGKNLKSMEDAVNTKTPFTADSTLLVFSLIRSVLCSIIAGFTAASIAKENTKSTMILGILLLAFGIYIQMLFRDVAPLWYHVSFLLLLIPMTILGGKLKKIKGEIR